LIDRPRTSDDDASRPPLTGRQKALLAAVLAAALVVRVAFAVALPQLDSHPDAASYDRMALQLVQGQGYDYNDKRFLVLPVLPLSLAATFGLLGHVHVAFHILEAVLGVLACLVTFLIGLRLWRFRVATLAAAAVAVHPVLGYICGYINTEAFLVLLVPLAALAALPALTRRGIAAPAIAGLVLGVAALTKAVALLGAPLLPLFYLARHDLPVARRLAGALLYGVCIALVLSPWVLRNYLLTGHVFLSCQTGYILYHGNDLPTAGSLGKTARQESWERLRQVLLDAGVTRGDELGVNRALTRAALRGFREQPLSHLALVARKWGRLWYKTEEGRGVEPFLFALHYTAILLACVGCWDAWRRRAPGPLLLGVWILVFWFAHGFFVAIARLSVPMLPLLALLASAGLFALLPDEQPKPAP